MTSSPEVHRLAKAAVHRLSYKSKPILHFQNNFNKSSPISIIFSMKNAHLIFINQHLVFCQMY